jgi:NifU-like protein involved in Fe-S cluster formation
MELSDLYSEKILDIATHIPVRPRLDHPDASARRASRICGSVIEVDLKLQHGVVTEFGQEVSACALGQTSAAIVAGNIVGATPDELRLLRTQMHAMLKADGAPPTGDRWHQLKYLEPVRDYPTRHASTLLVFDAVVDAIETIEGQPAAAAPVAATA